MTVSIKNHKNKKTIMLGTIVGGMAEAIWGVPETIKAQALEYLPAEMMAVYERFLEESGYR